MWQNVNNLKLGANSALISRKFTKPFPKALIRCQLSSFTMVNLALSLPKNTIDVDV